MKQIPSTILRILLLSVTLSPSVFASRIEISQREAWNDSNVLIINGIVTDSLNDNLTAYYKVQVLDVLKPKGGVLSEAITIIDPYYRSTAMINLKKRENVVLFVKKQMNGNYHSYREIHPASRTGQETIIGLKLFLKLLSLEDKVKQRQACLQTWQNDLSYSEKKAVLDAMWETRCSEYRDLLIDIAKSNNSAQLRSWAITILAYVDKSPRAKELVELLDDSDYDVRNQLLLFFGVHKVKEAIPRIKMLLKKDLKTQSGWQADPLRMKAQESLDKITGKDTSPYWK